MIEEMFKDWDKSKPSFIFENAIDSIQIGMGHYLNGDYYESNEKHAILTIYHGIELLLKEKLVRIHPILIFNNIDKEFIRKENQELNIQTIGLSQIIGRYHNLGIPFSKVEKRILLSLQSRRNRIEHYRYEPSKDDFNTIGMALKFVHNFLPNHLKMQLQDEINEDIYSEINEVIFTYEERVKAAEKKAKEYITDLDQDSIILTCPECKNDTMVSLTHHEGRCFFCQADISISICEYCECACDPMDFIDDYGLCNECFRYEMSNC